MNCEDKKTVVKLKQDYNELEIKYNEAIKDLKVVNSALKNDLTDSDINKKIVENVNLKNENTILKMKLDDIKKNCDVMNKEVLELNNQLRIKNEEMYDIKNKYELDADIQSRIKKIRELEYEEVKRAMVVRSLAKSEERIQDKINHLHKYYTFTLVPSYKVALKKIRDKQAEANRFNFKKLFKKKN